MDFDVIIVGAGLAGLALAVALKRSRLSVAVVESRPPVKLPPEVWDARIYAISPANQRFLADIGAWQHLQHERIEPVRKMAIFGDGGGELAFSAYDAGVSELAYMVESSNLQQELWETVRRLGNVSLFCPAQAMSLAISANQVRLGLADAQSLTGRLVVAADGAASWTRQAAGIEVTFRSYEQMAVVANFATEKPHRHVAYQWFRDDGILAYLPLPGNLISIVWSTSTEHAEALRQQDAPQFCDSVAQAAGYKLGKLALSTAPACFPLRFMRAPRMVAPRLALIGDAAHVIHPLSGHGINLGFQDAQQLAAILMAKPEHIDCGELAWLRRYERARKEEVLALQSTTDGLQKLFAGQSRPLALARNFGLSFTNHLPFIKDILIRYAMG